MENYTLQIHRLVTSRGANNIIFLIHGFNETDPTNEYAAFETRVKSSPYNAAANPVYVEVFWDGLTVTRGDDFPTVWPHAQNNTRYVCLGLRDLMRRIIDPLPFLVVTHSLGASVGTGALFNCINKFKLSSYQPYVDDEIDKLRKPIPAPVNHPIRLAMLAPAIPGQATFMDFDLRSPDIQPSQNNINRIIVGYNPRDFATTKTLLSGYYGSTTLGCRIREVKSVYRTLDSLGYQDVEGKLVLGIRFKTKPKYILFQDHAFEAYMDDVDHFPTF